MLHMENDFHSPSFRAMRYSSKRARSPEVGGNSPLDRPLKRPFLTVASEIVNMPAAVVSHGYYFAGGKSGNCSRYPLEDWVRQTDHLSIESPVMSSTSSSMGSEGKLPLQDDDEDEDVNMDSEEGIATNHDKRLAESLSSCVQESLRPSQRQLSSTTSEQLATTNSITGATVDILGVTLAPPSGPYFDVEPQNTRTRPSSPASNSSMMVSSPLPSYVNIPSPRRQQRFTMGPRADCEKCRLGVKGHWVHY